MRWSTFQLSSAHLAIDGGQSALDQLTEWFRRPGGPADMAMFSTQQSAEACATYYLSPATAVRAPALLRILRAKAGEPPPEDATLMAGATGAHPSNY
jgi:hypothetical protein